jgi:hypothetical protein
MTPDAIEQSVSWSGLGGIVPCKRAGRLDKGEAAIWLGDDGNVYLSDDQGPFASRSAERNVLDLSRPLELCSDGTIVVPVVCFNDVPASRIWTQTTLMGAWLLVDVFHMRVTQLGREIRFGAHVLYNDPDGKLARYRARRLRLESNVHVWREAV